MRICRDDKGNEEQSGIVDDKVQMIYERMSTTGSEKDEKKRAYRKSSKVGDHSSHSCQIRTLTRERACEPAKLGLVGRHPGFCVFSRRFYKKVK
jgi:hypothetical protein